MLCDIDLGVALDLIDLKAYSVPNVPMKLDAVDIKLTSAPVGEKNSQKLAPTAVPWLRKPQYLANDYSETPVPLTLNSEEDKIENKETDITFQDLEKWDSEENRLKLVNEINQTFEDSKQHPVHPTDPTLTAVEILPILPDEELWGNQYREVLFDFPPVGGTNEEERRRKRQTAIIKFCSIPNTEDVFLSYYTASKNDLDEYYQEDTQKIYNFEREYKYKAQDEVQARAPYFFVFREDFVSLVPTKAHVSLVRASTDEGSKGKRQPRIILEEADKLTPYAQEQRERALEQLGGDTL
eukprot:TRINITY_DN11406_c0_g1_i11.p1 TRINITY_DN11406_c0_g1~~TRINITY_DN11406_c0_g1_i11.p1  ORF type:complete len:296 (-),score=71.75 TRINITY_DN11406_c0_g1_i11:354-1241(-)